MAFQAKYWFKKDNTVVIEHIHDGTIRVIVKKNDARGNGGRGGFARWDVELVDDEHIKIKSRKTGKYLRICDGGNDVDVGGGGGKFTVFKVHVVDEPNVVKLESKEFPGKYVAVGRKKQVRVGGGGKHCRLTFFRNGGGGGDDNGDDDDAPPPDDDDNEDDDDEDSDDEKDVPVYEKDDVDPPQDSDDDGGDDDDADPIKEVETREPLSDDAEAVKSWLETVGYEQYVDSFLEGGYDKMSVVAMLDVDDLEEMGVKAGHRKELMLAARAAVFIGHWVALRCIQNERFIEYNEGNKKEVETNDENRSKDCRWFVEQSPDSITKVRFRSKYNSYLRMPTNVDKHMVTVCKEKDIDSRVDLQILPTGDNRRMNIVRIWCPSNANFVTYDSNVMKDRVNSLPQSDKKGVKGKQKWELIISD